MTTILQGIVGSVAYGLAHGDSDVDRLGVFAAPTVDVAGLDWNPHKESKVRQGPGGDDIALHEVGKYVRLALKANPTVMELLWLDKWETFDEWGAYLVGLRQEFLSEKHVRASYMGYARQQLDRFSEKGFKTKHARHTLRLIEQCDILLETGVLEVKVKDPQFYWDLEEMTPGEILILISERFSEVENKHYITPLPDHANKDAIREFLADVRLAHLT